MHENKQTDRRAQTAALSIPAVSVYFGSLRETHTKKVISFMKTVQESPIEAEKTEAKYKIEHSEELIKPGPSSRNNVYHV